MKPIVSTTGDGRVTITIPHSFDSLMKRNGELQEALTRLQTQNALLRSDLQEMADAFTRLRIIADRYAK